MRKGWICAMCVFDLGLEWLTGYRTNYSGKCSECGTDCTGKDNREYHEWAER